MENRNLSPSTLQARSGKHAQLVSRALLSSSVAHEIPHTTRQNPLFDGKTIEKNEKTNVARCVKKKKNSSGSSVAKNLAM